MENFNKIENLIKDYLKKEDDLSYINCKDILSIFIGQKDNYIDGVIYELNIFREICPLKLLDNKPFNLINLECIQNFENLIPDVYIKKLNDIIVVDNYFESNTSNKLVDFKKDKIFLSKNNLDKNKKRRKFKK
jgi:hypothetical protein